MKGEERRKQLLNILSSSNNPVSGGALSKELNVSRQIIVQDISLLRANGATIFSTNKGYLLQEDRKYSRVFKVYHTDDQVEEELSTIVDAGGQIRDVFVYHKVYGVLTSPWISGAVRNKKRKKFKNQAEHKSHPGSCYSKRISINSVVFRIFENIMKTQSVTFV